MGLFRRVSSWSSSTSRYSPTLLAVNATVMMSCTASKQLRPGRPMTRPLRPLTAVAGHSQSGLLCNARRFNKAASNVFHGLKRSSSSTLLRWARRAVATRASLETGESRPRRLAEARLASNATDFGSVRGQIIHRKVSIKVTHVLHQRQRRRCLPQLTALHAKDCRTS